MLKKNPKFSQNMDDNNIKSVILWRYDDSVTWTQKSLNNI